jgi:hypothetical protein
MEPRSVCVTALARRGYARCESVEWCAKSIVERGLPRREPACLRFEAAKQACEKPAKPVQL